MTTLLGLEVQKVPGAKLDYTFDWLPNLDGETIDSATWTAPSGITKVSESNTTTTASVRLSGGAAGGDYSVACHIVRSDGQERTRYLKVLVVERLQVLEVIKAPDDILDLSVDWDGVIGADTIATHAWTATGLTVTGGSTATVSVDGGTAGADYYAVDHIVTASGQEDERAILVSVRTL